MPPWFVLAVLVSLLAALGYQILRVQSLRRIPLYWIVILGCFLLAEVGADSAHAGLFRLGELAIIPDLLGVAAGMVVLKVARL